MHAIRLHSFGPPENLRYEQVPDPAPEAGQVLVHVEVAGVHVIDTRLRADGAFGPFPAPPLPSIPGREVAGRLDDGTRVVTHLGRAPHAGGYAELVAVDEASLHEVPDHVDARAAVAGIGTGRTALLLLAGVTITPDDVVLVRGAGGGIGHLLVQSARHAGATVYGTANPTKHEALRALGALVGPCEPTIVLDTTVPPPLAPPTPDEQRVLETRALELVASGTWQPLLTNYELRDAAAAHRAIEERTSIGKVVLVTTPR